MQTVDCVSRKRGTAVGLLLRLFRKIFAVPGWFTATQTGYFQQARHTRVAQFVSVLSQTAPTKINVTKCLHSQVLSTISRLTIRAALLCRTQRRVADLCSSQKTA